MMCPQRLARTDNRSLSSCLSMWASILLRQLRPQRLLRSPINTSIKTLTINSELCFVVSCPWSCSPLYFRSRGSCLSTKNITPNGGKLRPLGCHLSRGAAISVCRGGTARTERKSNAGPPHLVTIPTHDDRQQLMSMIQYVFRCL